MYNNREIEDVNSQEQYFIEFGDFNHYNPTKPSLIDRLTSKKQLHHELLLQPAKTLLHEELLSFKKQPNNIKSTKGLSKIRKKSNYNNNNNNEKEKRISKNKESEYYQIVPGPTNDNDNDNDSSNDNDNDNDNDNGNGNGNGNGNYNCNNDNDKQNKGYVKNMIIKQPSKSSFIERMLKEKPFFGADFEAGSNYALSNIDSENG
eukprot:Pgem_evm1s8339